MQIVVWTSQIDYFKPNLIAAIIKGCELAFFKRKKGVLVRFFIQIINHCMQGHLYSGIETHTLEFNSSGISHNSIGLEGLSLQTFF
jgi:hypothetical protein